MGTPVASDSELQGTTPGSNGRQRAPGGTQQRVALTKGTSTKWGGPICRQAVAPGSQWQAWMAWPRSDALQCFFFVLLSCFPRTKPNIRFFDFLFLLPSTPNSSLLSFTRPSFTPVSRFSSTPNPPKLELSSPLLCSTGRNFVTPPTAASPTRESSPAQPQHTKSKTSILGRGSTKVPR